MVEEVRMAGDITATPAGTSTGASPDSATGASTIRGYWTLPDKVTGADTVQPYWNQRAVLGPTSGTRDLIAVELERHAIETHVRDGMRVLDVGCGNGETALRLARQHAIDIIGMDYAEGMVMAAREALVADTEVNQPNRSRVYFVKADVLEVAWGSPFDLIYTQRCLINLPGWFAQRRAIERILSWLKPGGKAVLVENLQDGLDEINVLRNKVGMCAIAPPFHNRYLDIQEMLGLARELTQQGVAHPVLLRRHSATYYFLSRIVNAAMASNMSEPDYNSEINRLALELPGDLVNRWGQGVTFIWQRKGD